LPSNADDAKPFAPGNSALTSNVDQLEAVVRVDQFVVGGLQPEMSSPHS